MMGEPSVIEVVVAGPQGPVGPQGPENTKATEEIHAEKTARETAVLAAEGRAIPLTQKGAGSGVMALTAGGIGEQPPAHHASTHAEGGSDPLTVGDLPAAVVTGSLGTAASGAATGQVVAVRDDGTLHYFTPAAVSAKAWGVTANGVTDDSEAIINANNAAYAAGTYASFPEGTVLYKRTLTISAPWIGVPRKTVFKRTSEFTYSGLEDQFSIINAHGATTYNPATADTVIIKGIDFETEGTTEAGKGAVGLANVAGGEIWDCHLKTNGTNAIGALIDLYACVKNFKLDVQCENQTQAKTGGNIWIRNLAAKPEEASQATENIYVSPRTRCVTTTGDETIAVYGVIGVVKDVLIDGATLEGGPSTESHQRLASTFPSAAAERPHAAVVNVEWRKCKFVDVEGTIKEGGEVLGIGRSTGTAYTCQNIRHVDCTFLIKTTASKVVASRNIPSAFEGAISGIEAVRPYVNAEGSTEPLAAAMLEYPTVTGGKCVGNILTACKRCNTVSGGFWEATEKVFYDCNSVGGDYQFHIPNTTGILFYREANEGAWSGVASYGKGEGSGGRSLLVAHPTVEAPNIINLTGTSIATTAESGSVIETPTSGSVPIVNLRDIVATGPKELARKGTFAQTEGNTWYGALEPVTINGEAITEAKIAKEAVTAEKIKNEAVTSAKLATGSVTEAKIGAEAVSAGKIKNEGVTEEKIAPSAVSAAKIASSAVTSAKIATGAVVAEKLGAESVETGKIKAKAVTAEKIAASAVEPEQIKSEAVETSKIKGEAVTEAKLAKEAVTAEKIKGEAVTAAKLATGAVTEGKIGSEAVSVGKVKPGSMPTPSATENTIVLGNAGVARKFVAAITGNGSVSKWKIKHGLETQAITGVVLTETFEQPVTALAKVVAISASEVEVTFTAAPGAKVVNYLTLVG